MEPKLLNFWETGVCEDLTGGMWDWTHAEMKVANLRFNIIYIMRNAMSCVPDKQGCLGFQACLLNHAVTVHK